MSNESRCDGVSERVEDRRDIERDSGVMTPDVAHRQHGRTRRSSLADSPRAKRVRAQVAASGEAIAAMSANDVPSPLTIIPA